MLLLSLESSLSESSSGTWKTTGAEGLKAQKLEGLPAGKRFDLNLLAAGGVFLGVEGKANLYSAWWVGLFTTSNVDTKEDDISAPKNMWCVRGQSDGRDPRAVQGAEIGDGDGLEIELEGDTE